MKSNQACLNLSQNNDAVFSKFVSLNEGDLYMEPRRKALLAEAQENKFDKPFKMASPTKRSVGPGDYYGTIGGKLPHEPVRCPDQDL